MPRRILLMIGSMRGGGSERQILLLLKHLDRSRFTPHLYLGERAGDLLSQVPGDVPVHAYSDEPSSAAAAAYWPGRMLRRQTRHLGELLRRERIEVIYDRTFHMSLVAGPAAAGAGVPRVSTIVSPPEHALPLLERRFLAIKRRRLARAYRQASAVVAVSRQAAESAARYYRLPAESVRVIANPVDREAIAAAAAQGPPPGPPNNDRPTLVCVGRMTAEKGHRELLAALALAEQKGWPLLRVWMIGDGPLRGELEASARERLRHPVEFLGALPNPYPAMAAADALVCPSLFEGMPNVVLEAMALGTPVIATRAGGTVQLQRDPPTMLLAEPGDPESLAHAIGDLLSDRAAAAGRAEGALAMLRENHDLKANVAAIERLLAEAVG